MDQASAFNEQPTGIEGLDEIIGGALPQGDLVFVIGMPGAGKTVFALQLGFGRIRNGGKVLMLTSFSEGHDKLIAHLSSFAFFDQNVIGQQIQLLSIITLLKEGTEETIRAIVRTARQQNIDLIIIDGFRGIRDMFATDLETRQFLQTLGTQLAYLGTTLIITYEAEADNGALYPEITIADSVFALHFARVGRQHRRLFEVRKLRGQAPLSGVHSYVIDGRGVTIYPRFEALPIESLSAAETGRARFGLPALDAMLDGGLTTATSTLLMGNPGIGKSLLGLHFLMEGVSQGEPGLFISLQETADQLREKARAFGLTMDDALADDNLHILRRSPSELDVDELALAIRAQLIEHSIKRVVFDGMGVLRRALDEDNRTEDYFSAMTELLRARQTTSIFVVENRLLLTSDFDVTVEAPSVLRENVIFLQHVVRDGQLERIISVPTMRFSSHDPRLHTYVIADSGFEIASSTLDRPDSPIT
jgi:circadian clock protein KaiC